MNFQRTNTKISLLEDYYSHFNEDNRLKTRHGQVEFLTNIKYIKKYLKNDKTKNILDIGAGTGAYSIYLTNIGYDVTAVELVKHNIEIFKKKNSNVKIYQGNALDLSMFEDESFSVTLLFGPMYHLHTEEERIKVFEQARRVTKKDGFILVAYVMNDYSIIEYCFKKNKIKECLENGSVTEDFKTVSSEKELYSYLRLDDIDELNKKAGLERIKIIAADGPSDYMRRELNAMDEETFELFVKYQLANAERIELLGASSHTVDVLKNTK